ncbi:MAG: restriction endonuclease subunit S [Leucobacter sp.]
MKTLTTVRLASLGQVVTGSTPPAAHPDWFAPSGVPFVTPSDLAGGRRRVDTARFLSDAGVAAMKKRIVPANAVCFVSIGSTIGKICAPSVPSVTNQQINSLVVDPSIADPTYIYYALSQKSQDLKNIAGGSATPILNKSAFAAVELDVLPLEDQRAIAATLGALDDKIESNRRVIALSRQLTQSHYHAAAKHRVTASEVLTPVLGGTPKRDIDDYWNGPIKWASAKDIAGAAGGFVLETAETISAEGIANSAAKVMPAGTIVMTARGTVGALARLSEPMAFNQSCYGLRSHAGHEATLLAALEASVTRIKDSGHGTVFNTVNMATFDQIELDIPDDQGLNIVLENLSRKILQSLKENERLTRVRDSLLPELLSGRIRVPVEGVEA